MHLNQGYRQAERRVELSAANTAENVSIARTLYSSIADKIVNYGFPVLGMLPVRTQEYIRTRYPFFDPRIATASSAVGLGLMGYLLTKLPGDGSFAISYDFPHKLPSFPGNSSVVRPITLVELSPQVTKALAWYLMVAECGVRLYSAEVRKKAMAVGRPIPELVESLYRTGRNLIVREQNNARDVQERHVLEDGVMKGLLESAQETRRKEKEGLERLLALENKSAEGK